MQWLRHYAGVKYVTSLEDMTIRQLALDPEMSGVSLVTLERWCAEDRWVDKRMQYLTDARKNIEKKLGNRLVNERVKTLQKIDEVLDNAMTKLLGNVVQANSFEGLMSAAIRTAEFREKLLDKILAGIGPMEIGSSGDLQDPTRAKPNLSVDEVRDMARVVLTRRRALQRQDKKENKDKPKLRVLQESK